MFYVNFFSISLLETMVVVSSILLPNLSLGSKIENMTNMEEEILFLMFEFCTNMSD